MSTLPSPSTATLIALESAFDTPARNLTKSRGKNIHRYVSAKMGKRVTVESFLECAACYHFDFEPSIVRFCSQPIRFSYRLNGKTHTYVPDFLVQFDTGEYTLYEVKSDMESSKSEFGCEWEAKVQGALRLGLELELVTEEEILDEVIFSNLKLLHRYSSRDNLNHFHQTLLTTLKLNGTQTAKSLGHHLGLNGRKIFPFLCDLLSRNLLQTSLETPLSLESEFELGCYA
ncbi:endonuclease [Vibrio vulnificus]|uniref:TnsA endonuclease N-terminal domain-containing protein n=3 Tax=Vibrio vulnificus TaxID=672 RepID=UPI0010299E99|nr:TnsA endonuclease N-terminal domain-containing protein [Vibrio vulnificus]EHK8998480.1 TnsA endonuclease N-terminal domain-containing protein [Vibrio vulnificus]EIZ1408451.1 TnsA endonuclease N-terminal domain-containing protein [Vibrio vulnificus]EJA3293396.1 TnsA endonuclease N-terminal domain-containing protein [Vibrio vulnificus]EJA3297090.1 TnsA endonuclease N-terminal domain-containing protein [Vibrio vulnificus]EJB8415143.1 TnsA endonuclease N-terminal domain-containing protein [Vibr